MYEPSGEQLAEVRESGGDQWTVERTEAAAASPLTPIRKSRVASSSVGAACLPVLDHKLLREKPR